MKLPTTAIQCVGSNSSSGIGTSVVDFSENGSPNSGITSGLGSSACSSSSGSGGCVAIGSGSIVTTSNSLDSLLVTSSSPPNPPPLPPRKASPSRPPGSSGRNDNIPCLITPASDSNQQNLGSR